MPITLKKDVWKVKDPSSGQYRGAAILSTTLPQDAAQIISESNDTIQNIKDTAIEAVDTALNDESTGLIPKAEADRDAIDDSLNNASNGIIPTAQSDRDDIDDSLNNINDGIIPEAQANLATIAAAVQSQISQGTDKTLSVAKGFADAKAAGMMVKVSNYQPGSQLDDPATSSDASQNTGYPVYKDSNRVWVKESYAELEVPTMDDHNELKSSFVEAGEKTETVINQDLSNPTVGYVHWNNGYRDEDWNDMRCIVISIKKCDTIVLDGCEYNTNIAVFAERTGTLGNYTYTPLVRSAQSGYGVYEYKATTDCDVAVSFRVMYSGQPAKNSLIVYCNVVDNLELLTDKIVNIESVFIDYSNNILSTQNGYISKVNHELYNSSSWRCRVCDVHGYSKIYKVKSFTNDITLPAIAFYSSKVIDEDTFISSVEFSSKRSELYNILIPSNAEIVAFSSRYSSSPDFEALFVLSSPVKEIDALDVKASEFGNSVLPTYNLCDITKCKDNISITVDAGKQGQEVSANAYWSTDFIELDPTEGYYVYNIDGVFRTVFYDNEKAYLSHNPSYVSNMVPIPENAKYVRITFAKNKASGDTNNAAPFSLHNALVICYPYYTGKSIPHNAIDNDKYYIKDKSLFDISDIVGYASNKISKQFTDSFRFFVPCTENSNKNMIVSARAMWTGTAAPTIRFSYPINLRYTYAGGSYLWISPVYLIGKKGGFASKQWRIPPAFSQTGFVEVQINIPSGTTLTIDIINNRYDDVITRERGAIRLNAHQGFAGPLDTLYAYNMAARLGFGACITIPKRTADGVWVCFHDDDIIGRYARNDDGTTLPNTEYNMPISGFTYQELLQYDFGQYNTYWNGLFKGERIPTLAEFFEICAKTGMHPMLSCHPEYSSSEWQEIYNLAKKHNMLHVLNLKAAPASLLAPAYAIMGTEIESYTVDVGSDIDATESAQALGIDTTKVKVGIEYNYSYISEARINNALNAGFFVGAFNVIASAAVYEELIELGVTEFTEDYNCSAGLNW